MSKKARYSPLEQVARCCGSISSAMERSRLIANLTATSMHPFTCGHREDHPEIAGDSGHSRTDNARMDSSPIWRLTPRIGRTHS